MEFVDTHAHLFDDRFAGELEEVMARAKAVGVIGVISVGIDLKTSQQAVQHATALAGVTAAVGIQPNHVHEAKPEDWDRIVALAATPGVSAIGETGLDRYWDYSPFPLQEDYFARHLSLARQLTRPVVIHCREAEADVVRMLKEDFETNGPVRGVMHSFTGDAATLDACLGMGLHISFAGMVTYKSATELRELSKRVPQDRLLIETDCPYLAPVPHRGKRNEPAYVVETAHCLRAARGGSLADFAAVTTANARSLFG